MITKNDLIPLLNTMSQIYVNGQNAVIMGDCIRYVQELINRPVPKINNEECNDGEH